jgi:hypothetical protein
LNGTAIFALVAVLLTIVAIGWLTGAFTTVGGGF